MPKQERFTQKERYSGNDFLRNLENVWGGQLYFEIAPVFQDRISDISSGAPNVLREISEKYKKMGGAANVSLSSNLALAFKDVILSASPHQGESRDRIHLLADPFCRGLLTEELENFFRGCIKVKEDEPWIIEDKLPFALEGKKGVMFFPEPSFPTREEYFIAARAKAQDLANQLDLTDEEKSKFAEEFDLSMDRFEQYLNLMELNRHRGLHPFIQIASTDALLLFQSLEKPLPPRRLDLPNPLSGMFQEIKDELDTAPEVFGRKILSHAKAENKYLSRAVARYISQFPDEMITPVLNFFGVYYELFSRSARREGFSMIEVSDDLVTQYTDESKRGIEFGIQRKGVDYGLTLFLSDEELTNKEKVGSNELRQFWAWIDSIRQQYYKEDQPMLFGYISGALYYGRNLLYAQERENRFKSGNFS